MMRHKVVTKYAAMNIKTRPNRSPKTPTIIRRGDDMLNSCKSKAFRLVLPRDKKVSGTAKTKTSPGICHQDFVLPLGLKFTSPYSAQLFMGEFGFAPLRRPRFRRRKIYAIDALRSDFVFWGIVNHIMVIKAVFHCACFLGAREGSQPWLR